MKKLFSATVFLGVTALAFAILKNPEICTKSALLGLVLCGRVIIPSLFPFTFCVLFILKSGVPQNAGIPQSFSIFLLSLVGGYPLGAKMLSQSNLAFQDKTALLNFCVNAGPAFIILAVGKGVFGSQRVGVLLFLAHIIPSVLMALFFRKRFKKTIKKIKRQSFIENFVSSAVDASATLINICSFVILFSVIGAYLDLFSKKLALLKVISLFLEVTNGIAKNHNIYIASALLGFGGVCVWCQVFSLAKGIKIDYIKFILCRIFHALSSLCITQILLKIFKISLPALSNQKSFSSYPFADNLSVAISLFMLAVVFIISLEKKNFAGNILEDVV